MKLRFLCKLYCLATFIFTRIQRLAERSAYRSARKAANLNLAIINERRG